MVIMPNLTTLEQKITVSASPDEVYEAYVNPEKQSEFTKSAATGKPEVGEKFTAWDGYISGKYLELEKGRKIVQEWISTDWPEGYPPSRFELRLKATSKGTEITVIHSNIPTEQKEDLAEGWNDFYWEPMKEYFKNKKAAKKK